MKKSRSNPRRMRGLDSKADGFNRDLARSNTLLSCFLACLAVALGFGQSSKPVVKTRVLLATDGGHPGSAIKAAVVAEVAGGFHINDHIPTLDYLISTELKLDTTPELSVQRVVYPKGESKRFAFSDTALSVYEGTFLVGAVVKIGPAVRPGTYTLDGKFTYQACNDRACLPPARVPVSLTVKVVPRGVSLKRLNADVFNKIQFD